MPDARADVRSNALSGARADVRSNALSGARARYHSRAVTITDRVDGRAGAAEVAVAQCGRVHGRCRWGWSGALRLRVPLAATFYFATGDGARSQRRLR